ncbi:MAG: protein jag [Anaerolineae bacterium]|nr:protein jag [Anaerolineae bacterium]
MDEKTTLEMIAPTVEEAIERGLDQLGLPRDAVDIEVMDSGNKGLFGLGGRQARVRLTLLPYGIHDSNKKETTTVPELKPIKQEPVITAPTKVDYNDPVLDLVSNVVRELLEKMKVNATVSASYQTNKEIEGEEKFILVDIQGQDLSILIGKRSETLNALQYITSLILNKELGRWQPIIIDVQGYRNRRERQLRQMARRMADQALQSGRRQVLEPMPANERRYIHLELRDHPDVITESTGEEPNRKVTISKRSNN